MIEGTYTTEQTIDVSDVSIVESVIQGEEGQDRGFSSESSEVDR